MEQPQQQEQQQQQQPHMEGMRRPPPQRSNRCGIYVRDWILVGVLLFMLGLVG